MGKQAGFFRGTPLMGVLKDRDWMIIIGSLLRDRSPEGEKVVRKLMRQTKHGRQVRLLRLLHAGRRRTHEQLVRKVPTSRRTLFRDLNALEDYGIEITLHPDSTYSVGQVPAYLKRLL